MPTTLPVPSKGALRHLRNLALGTSFTLAFSTGLLTEDRRRRIRSAQEVQSNAHKLKSARRYHSSGAVILESLEEQVSGHREDVYWLPSRVAKSDAPYFNTVKSKPKQPRPKEKVQLMHSAPSPSGPITQAPYFNNLNLEQSKNKIQSLKTAPSHSISKKARRTVYFTIPPLLGVNHTAAQQLGVEDQDPQYQLAMEIRMQPNLDKATARFVAAFDDGIGKGGADLHPALLAAAVGLSRAGWKASQFEVPEKILQTLSKHGPMDEQLFEDLRPAAVIRRALRRCLKSKGGKPYWNRDQLKAVASMFLTPFKTEPSTALSDGMRKLGDELCTATYSAHLYDLTLQIYNRSEQHRPKGTSKSLQNLIMATYALGQYDDAFRHFTKFYAHTKPTQDQFYAVVSAMMDIILVQKRNADKAEAVLLQATSMAKLNALKTSTTWFLNLLSDEWLTSKDIRRTRATFGRMLPQIPFTSHPQALYTCMIQICITAGEEPVAMSYYSKLVEFYPTASKEFPIQMSFLVAKAMRKDWTGVNSGLHVVAQSQYCQECPAEFSKRFEPILLLHTQSHSVHESEVFLQDIFETGVLQINTFIMTMMATKYCESRELASLARWIAFAASSGCEFGVALVNSILVRCARSFGYSFDEVQALYKILRAAKITDHTTVSILRTLANSTARNDEQRCVNLKSLDSFLEVRSDPRDPIAIYQRMTRAFADNDLLHVLRLYHDALVETPTLNPKYLSLAVRASLKLHGDRTDEAAILIKNARSSGQNVHPSMVTFMIHTLDIASRSCIDPDEFSAVVQDVVIRPEQPGVEVSPIVTTHILHIFFKRGEYRSVNDFWRVLASRLERSSCLVDLPTLTILLQANLRLRSDTNVRWAIRMLTANNLVPDKKFRLILKEERKELRKQVEARQWDKKLHAFLDTVDSALQEVVEMRKHLQEDKQVIRLLIQKIASKATSGDHTKEIAEIFV